MTRSSKNRVRVGALAGLLALSATACQVPVGNPLGIPLVKGCTLFIAEPGAGDIVVPISAGALEIGCTLGL